MHRKDIKALKKKAAAAYQNRDHKEAYKLWEQAARERKALQNKV